MHNNVRTIRIRVSSIMWFAAGAVVAVIATATFAGIRASAAPGPDETTFVPITPCRLFDTRPGSDNVGPRATPLGPEETHVQRVTGANGNCTIPAGATGVSLNVTAAQPSAASFMTVFPSNAALPLVSNLNYLPGSPPTPNKVDVALSSDGRVSFYNLAGTVHAIADISGYYTRAGLADLQAQIESLHDDVDDLQDDIDANRSWTGEVAWDGTKIGPGPLSSTRASTGVYVVRFQVNGDHPAARYPSFGDFLYPNVVATQTCGAHTVRVVGTDGTLNDAQDEWTELRIFIRTYNSAGSLSDCGFYVTAAIPKRTPPPIIGPI